MFSTSVGRVVRSTCAACSSPILISSRSSSACLAATSRSHQRRPSSSKASIPPDGSRRSASSDQQTSTSTSRVGRRKTKDATSASPPAESRNQPFAKQYPNLPRVDSTQHLLPADVNVSSFFSLHRPISVTHAVPPPSTSNSFSAIFENRQSANKHNDVIFTLSSVVENMEQQASPDDQSVQWHVVSNSAEEGTGQVDGVLPGNIPLDKIISQFRPFRPPPAPQAFNDENGSAPETQKPAKKVSGTSKRVSRKSKGPKSWSTTIIVTEYTNPADGTKVCQVTNTPIMRVPSLPGAAMAEPEAESETAPMSQPFLRRMWLREQRLDAFRRSRVVSMGEPVGPVVNMQLISVKRQRKLKMKKHKYKKLMRRTRNLRRKLGKL